MKSFVVPRRCTRRKEEIESTPPAGYEKKFADFIKLCSDAKSEGATKVKVAYPWVLGDSYEEVMESLSRLADAGLLLEIAARRHWPSLN